MVFLLAQTTNLAQIFTGSVFHLGKCLSHEPWTLSVTFSALSMLYDTRKKKNTIKIRNKLFFVLIFQVIFSRRFNIVHLSLQLLLKFHLHVCQTKERPGESQN